MNTEIDQNKKLSSSSISTQQSYNVKISSSKKSICLIKGAFVFKDLDTEVIIYDDFIAFTNLQSMNIKSFDFNMMFQMIHSQQGPIGFRLIQDQLYEFYIQNWETADSWKKILLTKINYKGFHQYFNMQKRIGKGAFGTVYEATQFQTNQKYATKVFIKQNLSNHTLKSIQGQVNILRKLQNKNIVKFFGVYQTQFAYYLLFEYLEGNTLQKHIKNKHLTQKQRRQILKQILDALFYLKQSNIVHHDIKPENIFITMQGQIKVLDFGLASFSDIKSSYEWCGTAGYIAPQIFKSDSIDNKSIFKIDIFGLGSTFFKMLFNLQLYSGQKNQQSETEILNLNKKGLIKKLQNIQNLASEAQFNLLSKMIQVNPQKRICIHSAINHWYFTGDKSEYQKLQRQQVKLKSQKSIFLSIWEKIRPKSCEKK